MPLPSQEEFNALPLEEKKRIITSYKENKMPSVEEFKALPIEKKKELIQSAVNKSEDPGLLAKIGRGIVGFTVGVAENANILNLPRSLEVLGRAAFIPQEGTNGVADEIKVAEQNAVMPDLSLSKVAPMARAGARMAGKMITGEMPTGEEVSSVLREENKAQEDFNKWTPKGSQEGGQIFSALVGLASLGKSLGGMLKGEGVFGLSKEAKAAAEKLKATENLQSAKDSLKDIVGKLQPEIEKAIVERTSDVQKAMQDPNNAGSLFKSVQDLRSHIDGTQDLIGKSVGTLRNAIASENNVKLDTTPLLQMLSRAEGDVKLASGNVLSNKDLGLINKYSNFLANPTEVKKIPRNYITLGDTSRIIDQLDSDLSGFYSGKETSATLRNLKGLRDELDATLANQIPAYKETKVLYDGFINTAGQIRRTMDSTNAESFLNNLFGQSKTETRFLLEDLANQGQEAAASLKQLSTSVKSGSSDRNLKIGKAIDSIYEAADKTSFKAGKQFLEDIANKIAARKLNGSPDVVQDQIRSLTNNFVNLKTSEGQTVGAIIGSVVGGTGGMKSIIGGPVGTGIGALIGKQVGGTIGKTIAMNKAKDLYNVDNIIQRIVESKNATEKLKDVASSADFISKNVSPEDAKSFFELIRLAPKDSEALRNILFSVPVVNESARSR